VAGVVSRLDRERGAHHTPANAPLHGAVDVSDRFTDVEQALLTESGANVLRCQAGRGLVVWGGRTLSDPDREAENLYLAHRRLLHRLVRAIRRAADPLVFEHNGPDVWLALVRAVTTVLMQAYRAGALKGERPSQGFRVVCDESNNPPASIDGGFVVCEVQVAPATPMEFITLRIALSSDGRLEMIEQ
jgi:phage tail sheath protein FI